MFAEREPKRCARVSYPYKKDKDGQEYIRQTLNIHLLFEVDACLPTGGRRYAPD